MQQSVEITYPSINEKENVAGLWQDVFDDSPEYVEFFFNHVYKPENTLVIKRNGFIISALQMIPYKAKLGEKNVTAAYVCGACTHPPERGKGLMKALIRHAKLEMKRRGFSFAIVIPAETWLFDFYRALGFDEEIYHKVEHLSFSKLLVNTFESMSHITFEECTCKHFPFFDRKQHERNRTIIHDAVGFEQILQELSCDGGRSYVALRNKTPVGIAFAEKISKDSILVKDIYADTKIIFHALCRHAFMLFDAKHITICSPHHYPNKKFLKYGLGCNLDNNQFISLHSFSMSLMHD